MMRCLIISFKLCCVILSCSGSPLDSDWLKTNQLQDHYDGRLLGRPIYPRPITPQDYPFGLTKGEYFCGDKICMLRPGEMPAGCEGRCQSPVVLVPDELRLKMNDS